MGKQGRLPDILKKILKYYFTQGCPIIFTVSFLALITVKITLVTSSNLTETDSCSRNSYSSYSAPLEATECFPPQLIHIKQTTCHLTALQKTLTTLNYPAEDQVLASK